MSQYSPKGMDPRVMLDLDPATIRRARSLARKAGAPVVSIAKRHTTVSVERAVLRLAGLEGADVEGIPWVNRLVDVVRTIPKGAANFPRIPRQSARTLRPRAHVPGVAWPPAFGAAGPR